jgi:hypothetical protein
VQTGRLQDQVALTFRSSAGKAWTIEQEAQLDRQEEWTSLLGSQPVNGRQGWRSGRLRFGEAWRPVPRLSLRLGAIGRLRERIAAGSRYQVYQLIPGVQWLPGDRSRLDLQITRTWVNGPSGKLLGLERAGWEGRGSLGVRLRRWLDVSLVSDFSAPTAGTSRVNGRAEVKAIF